MTEPDGLLALRGRLFSNPIPRHRPATGAALGREPDTKKAPVIGLALHRLVDFVWWLAPHDV